MNDAEHMAAIALFFWALWVFESFRNAKEQVRQSRMIGRLHQEINRLERAK